MKTITFFDTEINPSSNKILDIGAINCSGATFHLPSIHELVKFLQGSDYICGHNIIKHDLRYLQSNPYFRKTNTFKPIDTLYLSPLLFPSKPYHRLLKDDKLQTDELNNPVNDSQKAMELFYDEVAAFNILSSGIQLLFYFLLKDQIEFRFFFDFISLGNLEEMDLLGVINEHFGDQFCEDVDLHKLITESPIELAYCLALINVTDKYSITPPWVIMNFPKVESVMFRLRNNPCMRGCSYCDEALDGRKGLKDFFGFESYRTFDGKSLQEDAVNAALKNKSLLAVFPTGGGKSLTFQIPSLMAGRNVRGLSVVISPLQSLMKDQVDNLEKIGITDAVTINGLLDPIERGISFQRVENGAASILYISPESLRSKSIERLLLGRKIVRFIIDEAHCFSSWGQDFRVDYLYIGAFIRNLQEKKNLQDSIPVSCFTATAKPNVITDICQYFQEELSLNLEVFKAKTTRTNLHYKVYDSGDEEIKYKNARILIDSHNCPTIIYTSRTRKAYDLAKKLCQDGFNARPYHGKMDIKEKSANQEAFTAGEVDIMVATSAFGMGVDKKDVGMVIHYDISDSLENYVQEAGRAGRDENISADCYVLFDEEDIHKHFVLLNQTKLSVKEIQQIWIAIKKITSLRATVSNSALEIARKAGWDDNVNEIETRVKTAISALEQAGYLKRGQNMPRIFANSILSKNAQEAIDKIMKSERFNKEQKSQAIRVIKKLFSSKRKKQANDEEAESRVDYISDHLGIVKEKVIKIITLLREEKILADTKDLTAFIKQNEQVNRSLAIFKSFARIENYLLRQLSEEEKTYHLKELNEVALENQCKDVSPRKIKLILTFWAIKNWIKRKNIGSSNHHIKILCQQPLDVLISKQELRHELSTFIITYLYNYKRDVLTNTDAEKKEILVEFSVNELKDQYLKSQLLFTKDLTTDDIEDALFYLSRIGALKIEGGFLVIYNGLTITRTEQNKSIQYKKEDYNQLEHFYQHKMQQIHIVSEYAKKMLVDYENALQFVEDYFQLNYYSFIKKHFPGSRKEEIQRNITPKKFKEIFGELSPRQLSIINDKKSQNILVAAGPGSGKTRVLVHKLASLLLLEEVKHEQLLMLTFSRAAATEFKKRLLKLIGNAAYYIEIKTFHSYCFDLLGKMGDLEKSDRILHQATENILSGKVEMNRITKSVLVIDEAQDMDAHEYGLIKALMQKNEGMRVIAVGDDDQNIYTWRGADSKHFEAFANEKNAKKYELVENYRSKKNLVEYTNQFVQNINHRFKEMSIVPIQQENGEIRVLQYKSRNLITPLINDILSVRLEGTIAILTITNEEAIQISGLLVENNFPAKLIQSYDGFDLFNLLEIRSFLEDLKMNNETVVIPIDSWNSAKINFAKKYKNTRNYELSKRLIQDFQETNKKIKYRSDFELFIKESKVEDFISQQGEVIKVSTIHKAKGKEFDHVFLLLSNFDPTTDDAKRQLYVAMTRAKEKLTVHYHGSYLSDIHAKNLTLFYNDQVYDTPSKLVIQLSLKDVNLGFFDHIQNNLDSLVSGQYVKIYDKGLLNKNRESILKFSNKFLEKRMKIEEKGYQLVHAKIHYILFWEKKNGEGEVLKELKIILPELVFEKEKRGKVTLPL